MMDYGTVNGMSIPIIGWTDTTYYLDIYVSMKRLFLPTYTLDMPVLLSDDVPKCVAHDCDLNVIHILIGYEDFVELIG